MALRSFSEALNYALSTDLRSDVGSGEATIVNGNSIHCDFQLIVSQDAEVPEVPEWVGINHEMYRFICLASDWGCDKPSPGDWDAPGTEVEINYNKYYVWTVDSYTPDINMVLVRTMP